MIAFHEVVAQVAVALHVVATQPEARSDAANAPACDAVQVQMIVAAKDPDVSVTVLAAPGATRGVVRRRGGAFGPYRVAFVGIDRVWLTAEGALCQAPMFRDGKERAATAAAPLEVTPGYSRLPPALAKGIQRVGTNDYVLDGGVRDQLLEAQATLLRGVKVVPEMKDGRNLGFHLVGIRAGTALAAIGLEDGDRISTVNGFDLTDPQSALEAYARLRTATRLTLTIFRGGKPANIDYEIR